MRELNLFIKRIIDILGSLIGMIILLPLFVIIAILIKLTSEGPVFFRQESRPSRTCAGRARRGTSRSRRCRE